MADVYDDINQMAGEDSLEIFGGFYPETGDGVPRDARTLIMFGPKEPGFWSYFTQQREFRDGKPNAMDRWSKRVIDGLANAFAGLPFYPFGGPPYHPFLTWAIKTGRSWHSPVQFLVHDTAGLLVSYRGALCFNYRIALPSPPPASPCVECHDKPCTESCPIDVLTTTHYDADGCRDFIVTEKGRDCLDSGCQVRRSCPVSRTYQREPRQSRFHQLAFAKSKMPH